MFRANAHKWQVGSRAGVMAVLTALALLAAGGPVRAKDLPDFTQLVEDNADAVVNISTVRHRDDRPRSRNDELDEFFRRFFPPDGDQPPPYLRPRSLGSGFVLDRDGYILTNNHVVEDADEILVRFRDRRELSAQLVGADPRSDLALIKVDADDLPNVHLGNSDSLKVGEWVLAIGAPFGFDYSVTAGIVSAKGRSLPTEINENYVPFIQTDVAINPGNSGGPLFNLKGEVVGINSQIYSNSGGFMGVSFAIPINIAMDVVNQLKATGHVARGWLGVVIQEVNRDLAESFGLDRPHGALVARVMDGSPAAVGGIHEGDIITTFNGQAIDRSSELPHFVGRVKPGSDAKLDVVREGKQMQLTVKVGELPDRGEPQLTQLDSDEGDAARLGITVETLTDADLERLDIQGGVRVTGVSGAAAEAGMRQDDVITKLDNRDVSNADEFIGIASELEPGRSVAVLVIRRQTPLFLALRVPE